MLRKLLVTIVAAIMVIGLSGCKKRPEQTEPGEPNKAELTQPVETKVETPIEKAVVKTIDYKAEAEKEINKKNMAQELEKLEKAVEGDIDSGL